MCCMQRGKELRDLHEPEHKVQMVIEHAEKDKLMAIENRMCGKYFSMKYAESN